MAFFGHSLRCKTQITLKERSERGSDEGGAPGLRPLLGTRFATRNKGHSLLVTSALLVVTRSYERGSWPYNSSSSGTKESDTSDLARWGSGGLTQGAAGPKGEKGIKGKTGLVQ